MKKLILSIISVIAAGFLFNVNAQINLDVEGRGIIRDGTPRLDLYDTDQNRAETYMFSSNGNFYLHSRYGDILFRADDNAGFSTRMFIDGTDGQVGIGTSSPSSRLHLVGGGEASLSQHGYLVMGNITSANLVLDPNEIQARSNGSAANLFVQPSGGNLYMDGNTFTMNAANNRIGIGTSSPNMKLHVVGGSDLNLSSGGYAQFGSTTGWNMAIDENEIQARDNGAGNTLYLNYEGGDLLLNGRELGQVGIGVLSSAGLPADQSYLLAVDGKIIAEELRVEISGSWPDYVFKEDYNLMSITEFSKSIKENGHLPGIPSAAEVAEDGQLIGDIQRKMLEKIEELSLYIIQLNEKNIELSEELNILKQQIK